MQFHSEVVAFHKLTGAILLLHIWQQEATVSSKQAWQKMIAGAVQIYNPTERFAYS